MAKFKVGDKVFTNGAHNLHNIDSGVTHAVCNRAEGNVVSVNDGIYSKVVKYLVSFQNVEDIDYKTPVCAWVPEMWLEDPVRHDRFGHEVYWVPMDKAVYIIMGSFLSGKVRAIFTGNYCDSPTDIDSVVEWSKIIAPDIMNTLDNSGDSGIFLMMGMMGGGYVGGAFVSNEEEALVYSRREVRRMLEAVTGLSEHSMIFLQLIEKDYPGNENELY